MLKEKSCCCYNNHILSTWRWFEFYFGGNFSLFIPRVENGYLLGVNFWKNKITCLIPPLQFCSKEKHGLLFKAGLLNCSCQVSSELAIFFYNFYFFILDMFMPLVFLILDSRVQHYSQKTNLLQHINCAKLKPASFTAKIGKIWASEQLL